MRILVFSLFLLLVSLLLHSYLWWRLIASNSTNKRRVRIGMYITAAFAVLPPTAMWASQYDAGASVWTRALSWTGFVWLGVVFYLLATLLATEPLRAVGRGVFRYLRRREERNMQEKLPAEEEQQDTSTSSSEVTNERAGESDEISPRDREISRRILLSRTLATGAGVVALGTVGYGLKRAVQRPVVEHMPITLTKLDPSLHGMRIGVVSDIHLGPFVRRARVEEIVHSLNRLDLSAVCIVGDLVDGEVDQLGSEAEPLGEITATHGTYFVTGNHEYYSGAQEWLEFLPTLGVRVLQNERRDLHIADAGIQIAGVNDVQAESMRNFEGPDLDAALAQRNPEQPVLLMAHQPVLFPDAAQRGVDLQVSGHTHGGQMWPFGYAVRLEQPIIDGYMRDGGSQLYVTRGAGFWGPPIRVGSPPEITVLELHSNDQ